MSVVLNEPNRGVRPAVLFGGYCYIFLEIYDWKLLSTFDSYQMVTEGIRNNKVLG
jgi:hypothetical protein